MNYMDFEGYRGRYYEDYERSLWGIDFPSGFESSDDIPENWDEIASKANSMIADEYERLIYAYIEQREKEAYTAWDPGEAVLGYSAKLWEAFCESGEVGGIKADYGNLLEFCCRLRLPEDMILNIVNSKGVEWGPCTVKSILDSKQGIGQIYRVHGFRLGADNKVYVYMA